MLLCWTFNCWKIYYIEKERWKVVWWRINLNNWRVFVKIFCFSSFNFNSRWTMSHKSPPMLSSACFTYMYVHSTHNWISIGQWSAHFTVDDIIRSLSLFISVQAPPHRSVKDIKQTTQCINAFCHWLNLISHRKTQFSLEFLCSWCAGWGCFEVNSVD